MAFGVTINGVDKTSLVAMSSLSGDQRLNGNGVAKFRIIDTSGAYRPTLGHPVLIYQPSVVNLFGGLITSITERAWPGSDTQSYDVACADYGILCARRYLNTGTLTSQTVNYVVTNAAGIVATSLGGDNVTTTGTIGTGATIGSFPATPTISVKEGLDRLCEMASFIAGTRYIWWMDPVRNLVVNLITGRTAAWNLTDANPAALIESITVTRTDAQYINQILTGAPLSTVYSNAGAITTQAAIEGGSGKHWRNDNTIYTNTTEAGDAGQGMLARYSTMPVTVTYQTDTGGLLIGDTQTINLTRFGINTSFYIESIKFQDRGDEMPRYTITANSTSPQGHWSEAFQKLVL